MLVTPVSVRPFPPVPRTAGGDDRRSSLPAVLVALARRLAPYLIESTVIPTLLFYAVDAVADTFTALVAGLA